jgi:hypothetical protein
MAIFKRIIYYDHGISFLQGVAAELMSSLVQLVKPGN